MKQSVEVDRDTFVKVFTLNQIKKHLKSHKDDLRHRESLRVRVALRTIAKWEAQAEAEYDRLRDKNKDM
jgi:hypothetical protein